MNQSINSENDDSLPPLINIHGNSRYHAHINSGDDESRFRTPGAPLQRRGNILIMGRPPNLRFDSFFMTGNRVPTTPVFGLHVVTAGAPSSNIFRIRSRTRRLPLSLIDRRKRSSWGRFDDAARYGALPKQ
mmetsp:Transcript_19427/g.44256  ORF Transcript_19427/g.44256 Transcript_19427/m.44256 type:complete len:131 (-) Transcript_19427:1054-1446(-)